MIIYAGCKVFSSQELSSGILVFPPSSTKPLERADHREMFVITACEPDSIECLTDSGENVEANDPVWWKITGDVLHIPAGVIYAIRNISTTTEARMHFLLVKTAAATLEEAVSAIRSECKLSQTKVEMVN